MAYRLGFGEVVGIQRAVSTLDPAHDHAKRLPPEETIARLRDIFFYAAERLYPRVKLELLEMEEDFQADPDGFVPEFTSTGPIGQWCRRWNLVNQSGEPADWAMKVAYESLASVQFLRRFHREPEFVWCVSCGGATPNRLESARDFDPTCTTIAAARKRTPRKHHKGLSAQVEQYLEQGWATAPTLQELEHVEWLVEHTIGGFSCSAIAERRYPASNYERDRVGMISKEVSKLRRLMDWPVKLRRPGKRAA